MAQAITAKQYRETKVKKPSKYRNLSITIDGITFQSQKEGKWYLKLKEQEKRGEITGLLMQVPFLLIPAYHEPVMGKRGVLKRTKCIERELTYVADFTFYRDGIYTVMDCKGMKTDVYKIKRKLMYHFLKIRITEV